MLKSYKDDSIVYILSECVTCDEDVSMEIINESTETTTSPDGTKIPQVTANTTLQSFNVQNWNKRIYGDDVVMESLDQDGMIQNDIKKGQWIGEFSHPLDTSPKRQMILYAPTASHRILKYWKEGNLLKGTVQTLPYGHGIDMARNALGNVPWAFSLRSLGSVDLATRRVKKPLKIITYDHVYRPSHIEAYDDKTMLNESVSLETLDFDDLKKMRDECSLVHPINESMDDILGFVTERSQNLQIVADMFKLDSVKGTLNESGTRMDINVDDKTTLNVPIETVIRMQYADILNSIKQ